LAVDYNPGDTSITIFDEDSVMSSFPSTGIITLTEQCSDVDSRSISFHYSGKTATTFTGLELLSDFTDVIKPKDFTNVTLNVMARHHNSIKNAVIAIETFIGVEGTTDTAPFGDTIEGRLNFLTRLILTPRAWFSADKTADLVPLTVMFTDESFRLGDGDIVYTWDFGDTSFSSVSVANISVTTVPSVSHIYTTPGIYDVTLTVSNEYGSDIVKFDDYINAKVAAPDEAVIEFVPKTGQTVTAGRPAGGP